MSINVGGFVRRVGASGEIYASLRSFDRLHSQPIGSDLYLNAAVLWDTENRSESSMYLQEKNLKI